MELVDLSGATPSAKEPLINEELEEDNTGLVDLSGATNELKEEDTLVVDGQNYFQYDGDTIINADTNESVRIKGIDAGELARIGKDYGELNLSSYSGPIHKQVINQIIKDENFNTLVKEEEKDPFGRTLGDLVNPSGGKLSDYLAANRIAFDGKYASESQNALESIGRIVDRTREAGGQLDSGMKARALVEAVIGEPDYFQIPIEGTPEEVLSGSGIQINFIQSEINRIAAQLKKSTDPEEKEELKRVIGNLTDDLTAVVNMPKLALTTDIYASFGDDVKKRAGYWGETVASGYKSYLMMSNTLGGFSAWAGDMFNNEALEAWGDNWGLETNEDIRKAGYTTGLWDVRNPYDALRFISNTFIQYSPQMGFIYASALGGGAIGSVVPVLGTVAGTVIGATGAGLIMALSSVYQSQPEDEKDPLTALGIAMPVALVDMFGITKAMPTHQLFTKEGQEIFVNALQSTGKAASKKEAEVMLKEGIKKVLIDNAEILQDHAAKQMLSRKTFQDVVTQVGKSAGIEGATEAVQEAIEEVGVAATTSLDLDWEQLTYRMIEGGAIGSIMGGGFQLPGTLKRQQEHNEAVFEFMPENQATRSKISLWNQYFTDKNKGRRLDKTEVVGKIKKEKSYGVKINEYSKDAEKPSVWRDLINTVKRPRRFFQAYRGFADESYDKRTGEINENMQIFGDLMDHIKLFSGGSLLAEHRMISSVLFKNVPSRAKLTRELGIPENRLFPLLQMRSELLAEQNLTDQQLNSITEFQNKFRRIREEVENIVKQKNTKGAKIDVDISENLFVTPNSFKQGKIDQNFKELLLKEKTEIFPGREGPSFTEEEVDKIVDESSRNNLSIENINKLEKNGIFFNPAFQEYVNDNVYDNALDLINSVSKNILMQERFGKNGEVFSYLLNEAEKKGEINSQQKSKYAAMAVDYMNMLKNSYNPINNKVWRNVQDNALFFGTITYMDSNFFANMAEMMNSMIGLTPRQMFTYFKDVGTVFTKSIALELGRRVPSRTGLITDKTKREMADNDLRIRRAVEIGTMPPRGGISHLEGVDVTLPIYQKFLNHFWNWNQVENQTNAIRAGRSAAAWEPISKMVSILANNKTGTMTAATRFAKDRLEYYGLKPDFLVNIYKKLGDGENSYDGNTIELEKKILDNRVNDLITDKDGINEVLTKEEQAELLSQYRIGIASFTDEFTVRPEAGSTPKIIEDPRFALFTQFKRFISHFTANVIPRMYTGYLRSGKPGMPYNVFVVLASAYGMAFVSMMIKDAIVYGEKAPWLEDDEEDPNWLRTSEARALTYTGWFGTPQMAVEFIYNYARDSRYKDPLENIWDSVLGESPSLNSFYQDFYKSDRSVQETIAKRMPFLGDVKASRESIEQLLNEIGKR